MKKIVFALVVVLLAATDSYACHRGLFARIQERRKVRQQAPQACVPSPQFVPAQPTPKAPVPTTPKTGFVQAPTYYPSITVSSNGNCVGGNCAGPTTIQRGGLLFRR